MQFIVIQVDATGALMAHYAPSKHEGDVVETSCEVTSVEQFAFINAMARVNNAVVTLHSTVEKPTGWTRNRKVITLCARILEAASKP